MNLEDINTVKQLFSVPQKVVIVPHKNPDGDAIGSTLALWHYLKNLGQEATIVSPNDYPQFLKWMPGNDEIINFERENSQAKEKIESATLICTLDFNHLGRTGQMENLLNSADADFIMIDHHQQPDDYAKVTYSDVFMSSTCEMVYNFMEFLGDTDKITPEIATCLYTGIMTDTGSFKFSLTTSRTHRVVADLMQKGAQNTEIHHMVYDSNTANRMRLLGIALGNLVILDELNTAYITLTQEELDSCNYQKGDTEGFVNYGLTLKGIKLAAFFVENREEGIIKISFRSVGNFSVNQLARKYFEGGGHNNAAGGKSDLSIKETVKKFRSILGEYKDSLE